ncbi:MAG: OmpA family protein [Deltaproteobacteria bacterium]|nr:OmpA family protein [Deltaproteobacteria bacterium]
MCSGVATVVAVVVLGGGVSAQVPDSASDFTIDAYEPGSLWGLDVLTVQRSRVPRHLGVVFGAEVGYVHVPLELAREGAPRDVETELVSRRVRADVGVGLGLFDRFAVALAVPLVIDQAGADLALLGRPGEVVSGASPGDLRLAVRASLFEAHGLGIGAGLEAAFPTGDTAAFQSFGAVRVKPTVMLDWHDRATGFGVIVNLGWHVVPETLAHDVVVDDAFTWGVGLDLPTGIGWLDVEAAIFGAAPIASKRDAATGAEVDASSAPVELVAAFSARGGDVVVELGGGAGLSRGVGAPAARAFLSLSWAPVAPIIVDSDGDGLPDPRDACPLEAEDVDGFEDHDGCPDLDDDSDGIPDAADGCPREPEDVDGFEDRDGCPEPDNDRDGVSDWSDACRDVPEDKDGFEDEDGCPESDNDRDGVPDDVDGPTDATGLGSCRDAPEVKNGYRDEDGCPDEAPRSVRVTRTKIEILEKVYFDFNKATIKPKSFDLLDEVARVMREAPELTKIRVEGHTDHAGDAAYNDKLSQARAEAVMAYLVAAGIAPERLFAQGYGERRPIVTGPASKREAGMAMNRRVEFIILEVDGKPQDPDAPVIIERPTPVP